MISDVIFLYNKAAKHFKLKILKAYHDPELVKKILEHFTGRNHAIISKWQPTVK
jgi:hypothetical protein